MDMSRFPYYCAFILFGTHVVRGATTVLPPTNMSFRCHNMQNSLSWAHDEPVPGLKFKVSIYSKLRAHGEHLVTWPEMSFDLSNYSAPEDDYAIQVSAVLGDDTSINVPEDGIVYSYFMDSPSPIKCGLDLPAVELTTLEENRIHFSFTHPGLIYLPHSQDGLSVFDYNIQAINQESRKYEHTYSCTEAHCQGTIHVDDGKKSFCLNISGEMKKMSVQATQEYCSVPWKMAGINPLAYVIPIVLLLVGGILIAIMVFIKKTRDFSPGPAALIFPVKKNNQQSHAQPEGSDCAILEPSSPVPLLPPDQSTSSGSSTYRDEVRLPLGVPALHQENHLEAQEATENGYSPGNCLDGEEDEQPHSAYERRDPPAQL